MGPPGVGKTILAFIIAKITRADFITFSAASSGIKEIKEVMLKAETSKHLGIRTLLFVDEIHRFNKAQQDVFLPYVEKGSIILIGATTENPSFEVNSALLSRSKVFVLKALNPEDIGIADPAALQITVASYEAAHYIGMPECTVNLTQAVVYLAMAPNQIHYTLPMKKQNKMC